MQAVVRCGAAVQAVVRRGAGRSQARRRHGHAAQTWVGRHSVRPARRGAVQVLNGCAARPDGRRGTAGSNAGEKMLCSPTLTLYRCLEMLSTLTLPYPPTHLHHPPPPRPDGWSAAGPSEMDKDAVTKMGMSPADVKAMTDAWQANQAAWREALVAKNLFEWFLVYGGQQTAPGQNQTCGQCTCQSYLETNCGPDAPSQNGTLFFGYSRSSHRTPFPPPTPLADQVMFMLSRGPYAWFGYGASTPGRGALNAEDHPWTRPPPSPPQRLVRVHRRGSPLYALPLGRRRLWHPDRLLRANRAGRVDAPVHESHRANRLRHVHAHNHDEGGVGMKGSSALIVQKNCLEMEHERLGYKKYETPSKGIEPLTATVSETIR